MPELDRDAEELQDQSRDVEYERDLEKVALDQDSAEVMDENERPGLMDGAPFIPPVAYVGPNAGVPNLGMGGGSGTGAVGLPPPVVPVVEGGGVDTGVLVNPFTPADPDNEKPFRADIPNAEDLPSRVEAELVNDGRLGGSNIAVVNDNGVIHLTGTVPDDEASVDAVDIASRVPGVLRVVNELTVSTS